MKLKHFDLWQRSLKSLTTIFVIRIYADLVTAPGVSFLGRAALSAMAYLVIMAISEWLCLHLFGFTEHAPETKAK